MEETTNYDMSSEISGRRDQRREVAGGPRRGHGGGRTTGNRPARGRIEGPEPGESRRKASQIAKTRWIGSDQRSR
jgi:hypothetical protein